MWNAPGKIPESAGTEIIDKLSPLGVDSGDASGPIQHVGPFGLLVPMQFAHAACVQSHLHAGHRFRNTKFPLRHLAGPAAAGLPHMRVSKRETEVWYCAGIRGGRIEHVRVLTLADWVTGDGIVTANSGRPAWLHYPIAGLGNRGRCARQHSAGNGRRCKHIPACEITHVVSPILINYS